MSRYLYGEWIADVEKKGIRLISYDRPGYGDSTAYPGHRGVRSSRCPRHSRGTRARPACHLGAYPERPVRPRVRGFAARHGGRCRDGGDLRKDREEILAGTPEQLAEQLQRLISPADAEVLTGDLAQWLTETNKVALAPGEQGWWDDGAAQLTSWGFDLRDIRVPVKIWHGHQDRFVPVQHGQWLAAHVPGAEADISDRDGHLTMIGRIGEIHDWLIQYF